MSLENPVRKCKVFYFPQNNFYFGGCTFYVYLK
nr:MAG TPA: hypothetical protein [Caudoviricetes sp.]